MFDWNWLGAGDAQITLFGRSFVIDHAVLMGVGITLAVLTLIVGATLLRGLLDWKWPDRPDWIR